jgi:hypothetical protein
MKQKIFALIHTVVIVLLSGCSSEEPGPRLTDEEKQMEKLAKAWVLGVVTYGDDDVTTRFTDFKLTLTKEKTYTASGSLGDYDFEPFKSSGTWDFKGGNLNLINRNDGVDMAAQVGDKQLVLTFAMTESNGRVAGLGAYRFDLVAE